MAFCSKCGAQNADGASFCTNCGAPMNVAKPQPQPQPQQTYYAQPQPQPQPQPVYYAQPAAPKKEVSKGKKIASLILCIHSLLYALAALGTCWIPGFGGCAIGLAFIGLITGIIGCALYKRGLGVAGIVISAISIVVAVVMLIVYAIIGAGTAFLGNIDFQSMFDDFLNELN